MVDGFSRLLQVFIPSIVTYFPLGSLEKSVSAVLVGLVDCLTSPGLRRVGCCSMLHCVSTLFDWGRDESCRCVFARVFDHSLGSRGQLCFYIPLRHVEIGVKEVMAGSDLRTAPDLIQRELNDKYLLLDTVHRQSSFVPHVLSSSILSKSINTSLGTVVRGLGSYKRR